MSPRYPGTDDAGRPVVAELGRAETPGEIADRKAAARSERRRNQTAFNLGVALVASLAIVAFLVVVVVRPNAVDREPVDYAAVAADAQGAVDVPLVVPASLPEGWVANRAQLRTGAADGVVTWSMGIVTADEGYLAIDQGVDANASWVAERVDGAAAGPVIRVGGLDWTSYDRRDAADPGNVAFALARELDGSTLVLSGTASDEEFAALIDSLGGLE
ncbi:MAG: DUF4245 domain-containing protein [Actinomycetales bacterium]|nr:DUF4245 domain-containing protein [Actinomycetales bacterium]